MERSSRCTNGRLKRRSHYCKYHRTTKTTNNTSNIVKNGTIQFIPTRHPKRHNNDKYRKASLERSSRCPNGRSKRRSHYVSIIKQQQKLLLLVILSNIKQYRWIQFIPTRRPKRHNNNKYQSKTSSKPY